MSWVVVHVGLQNEAPLRLQTKEGGLDCSRVYAQRHAYTSWSVCLYLPEHSGTVRVHSWTGGGGGGGCSGHSERDGCGGAASGGGGGGGAGGAWILITRRSVLLRRRPEMDGV